MGSSRSRRVFARTFSKRGISEAAKIPIAVGGELAYRQLGPNVVDIEPSERIEAKDRFRDALLAHVKAKRDQGAALIDAALCDVPGDVAGLGDEAEKKIDVGAPAWRWRWPLRKSPRQRDLVKAAECRWHSIDRRLAHNWERQLTGDGQECWMSLHRTSHRLTGSLDDEHEALANSGDCHQLAGGIVRPLLFSEQYRVRKPRSRRLADDHPRLKHLDRQRQGLPRRRGRRSSVAGLSGPC